MLLFGQSLLGNALFVVAGAIAALLMLNLWDWSRLRSWNRSREQQINEAKNEVEGIKTEGRLAAKIEAEELRQSVEERLEIRETKLLERENHFQEREALLNKQLESLSVREHSLEGQRSSLEVGERELVAKSKSVGSLETEWKEKLSQVAGLTQSEARKILMSVAESEGKRDAHEISRRIIEQAKQESEEEARRIVSLAIQRYAGDHTSESTTASVALKGDDIKGRIIGREGRNIRAF